MTTQDLRNLAQIIFSKRKVKLYPYEPYKKNINNRWTVIKNIGYPPGTPDMMGWCINTGIVYACENKTKNDFLSSVQIDRLNYMTKENCECFILEEIDDNTCILTHWRTNEKETINIKDYK